MKNKIRVMVSDTFDPWFNLATEDYIFRDMDPETKILFLWRNDKNVVIGRFQNPWTECNTKLMEEEGIKLSRRQSGGGAVYQDLGNTCFTFMGDKKTFDKSINNQIIINALKKFEVEAFASGRNDILVKTKEGDKKFSGSAFKENIDRSFHHGTLLINADMAGLSRYLSPHPKKLESKGITSVKARVCNLQELNKEITHESLTQNIIHEFFNHYQNECEVEKLNHDYLNSIPKLKTYFDKMSDWQWRFGQTPKFDHTLCEKFSWGFVEVFLNVKNAFITESKVFSDSLNPEMIEELNGILNAVKYEPNAIRDALLKLQEKSSFSDEIEEFKNWISQEIK